MKNEVMKKCDLLVENLRAYSRGFWFNNHLLNVIAAMSYSEKGKVADISRVKECRKLLRRKQNILSYFRGNNELIAATSMALSNDPEQYIDELVGVYNRFQQGKILGSTFRALASITICDAGKASEADSIIARTNEIMALMKSKHPFITTSEDTSLAVILAMTDKSVDDILNELENTYVTIKSRFTFHENAAYSLAQMLTAFEGNYESKCDKALDLFNEFKTVGSGYGKDYELASLGILTNISMNTCDIVSEVVEAAKYLKGKKGLGFWSVYRHTRLMIAATIVHSAYAGEDSAASASVIGGTISRVIAEQIMLMVIVASAATSAAGSSN